MRVCTGFHHSCKSRPISNQATEQTALVIPPIKERRDFLHDRSPHHLDNQLIHILCRFSGRKKLVAKSEKRFPHQPYLVRGTAQPFVFLLYGETFAAPPFLSAPIVSADVHHGKCANENLPKSEYGSLLKGCRRSANWKLMSQQTCRSRQDL